MHLIIEEAYITVKGFLKHLSRTLNIYFVRNMTLIFLFLRGFRLLLVYTHTPLVVFWISVSTGQVVSVQHLQKQHGLMQIAIRKCDTKKVYNISLAFHQLDGDD